MTKQGWRRLAALIVVAGLTVACGGGGGESSATSSAAPSPVAGPVPSPSPTPQPAAANCATGVSGIPSSVPAQFGRYPFAIALGAGCSWNAGTDVVWADISPGSGSGNASPLLNVNENANHDTRTITVTVNGQVFRVVQQPPVCVYSVQPTKLDLSGNGGGVTVELTTDKGWCTWTASASENWIRVVTPSGTGSESVMFDLTANPGGVRAAYLTVAGLRIDVTQQRKP